jgi:hypothetical protein
MPCSNNVPKDNKSIVYRSYLAVPEINGEINELGILLN